MKRWLWFGLVAVVVIVTGVTLVALPRGQEWTTSSPEALAEFEAGKRAEMKLYHMEAAQHFERAVELDPDFVIAKLHTVDMMMREDEAAGRAIWDEVLAADTSKLNPRERYLIERSRLHNEQRWD